MHAHVCARNDVIFFFTTLDKTDGSKKYHRNGLSVNSLLSDQLSRKFDKNFNMQIKYHKDNK